MTKLNLNMVVNGTAKSLDISPRARLLDVLRQDCGLTGTKEGCGEGECGACTVLIDGEPVNSCLVAAASVEGQNIETIEALATNGILTHVQSALMELGGTQCGICTPGIALTAECTLRQGACGSRAEIRERLAGNLCRCTGYQLVVDAVVAAAGKEQAKAAGDGGKDHG